MHKGVIIIVEAKTKEMALNKTDKFMARYKNKVWDWWTIGGRWTGQLDGYDPEKDPENYDNQRKEIKWPTRWREYENNAMPLKDCLDKVKEWSQDPLKEGHKEAKEAERWITDLKCSEEGRRSMYAYCLSSAIKILEQQFSFECNVYNIKSKDFSIPEDLEKYYAVIVDMHN